MWLQAPTPSPKKLYSFYRPCSWLWEDIYSKGRNSVKKLIGMHIIRVYIHVPVPFLRTYLWLPMTTCCACFLEWGGCWPTAIWALCICIGSSLPVHEAVWFLLWGLEGPWSCVRLSAGRKPPAVCLLKTGTVSERRWGEKYNVVVVKFPFSNPHSKLQISVLQSPF